MGAAKFVVRGGRRWRELDPASGRVSGWGDVRFVCVRRGRLELVRRAPLLRALRALAAAGAKRSAAKDGPRLSQIRYPAIARQSKGRRERESEGLKRAQHTCCQQHHLHCSPDANFNSILKPPTSTVGVQCSAQASAAVQVTLTDRVTHIPSQADQQPPRHGSEEQSASSDSTAVAATRKTNSSQKNIGTKAVAGRRNQNQESLSSDSDFEAQRKNHLQNNQDHGSEGIRSKSLSRRKSQASSCKELVISEQIVLLLRSFIERDERNAWGLDLERYDADDAYKLRVFFRLNPLVKLERCEQITRMLRDRASRADSVSLNDFVSTLGLRSVADSGAGQSRYRMRARGADKENREAAPRRARDYAQAGGVLAESRPGKGHGNQLDRAQAKRAAERSEPAARAQLKEGAVELHAPLTKKRARDYSAEEDAFIVRWVRGEGRARLVNGNRLWRQLQPHHKASTGCARTWHSLRNRYLRYLLPALGALDLPPHEAARLRAAASAGELKARKLPARRNSVFQQPSVRSAWGRRPRPQPHETVVISDAEDDARTAPTRVSRTPPATSSRARTPTYSELTRRFARRHRSTPGSDTASPADTADTTSTLTTSTVSTDRRARPARRSDTRASGSESDTRRPPRRRTTRQRDTSAQVVDVNGLRDTSANKKDRRDEKSTRNIKTKEHIRSISLDSDTDDRPYKLRRSSRHADNDDRQVENSALLADKTESNRRRTRSQDTGTDSLPSNKRRRTSSGDSDRRADTSVALRRTRTRSVYVETDTSLSDILREISADSSDRQSRSRTRALENNRRRGNSSPNADKNDRHRDNSAQNTDVNSRQSRSKQRAVENNQHERSGQDADTRNRHLDKSVPDTDKTGRRNESAREGVSNDSPRQRLNADQLLIKDNRKGHKNDRRREKNTQDTDKSDRQSVKSVRNADKSDRQIANSTQLADKTEPNRRRRTRSRDTDTDIYSLQLNKRRRISSVDSDRQAETSKALKRRRTRSVYIETDRRRESSGQNDDENDRHRDKSAQDTDKTGRRNESAREGVNDKRRVSQTRPRLNAGKLLIGNNRKGDRSDRQRENDTQDTDKSDRQSGKSVRNADKEDRHRDESTQNAKEKGGFADKTDRPKPRTRRLYNPNAI